MFKNWLTYGRKVIYCVHTAGRILQTQKQVTASAKQANAESHPGFFRYITAFKIPFVFGRLFGNWDTVMFLE